MTWRLGFGQECGRGVSEGIRGRSHEDRGQNAPWRPCPREKDVAASTVSPDSTTSTPRRSSVRRSLDKYDDPARWRPVVSPRATPASTRRAAQPGPRCRVALRNPVTGVVLARPSDRPCQRWVRNGPGPQPGADTTERYGRETDGLRMSHEVSRWDSMRVRKWSRGQHPASMANLRHGPGPGRPSGSAGIPEVVLGVRPDRGSVPWTKKVLETLQSRLGELLEQIDGIRTATPESPLVPRRAKIRIWGDWSLLPSDSGRRLVALYTSDDSDKHTRLVQALLLRVADLLTRIDLSRLRRCSERRRLFVAFHRQKFDTPQCSQRDRLRRFRNLRKPTAAKRPTREARQIRSRKR